MRKLILVLVCLMPLLSVQAQSDDSTVVADNTQFATDLYQVFREAEDGNFVFSPYSITQAFAMTYAGARGNTETQLADVFHFATPQDQLHLALAALNGALTERGDYLKLANALWIEQSFAMVEDYLNLVITAYGSLVQPADFINSPDEYRQTINEWVAFQTADRIQDLIPAGAIDSSTRVVLTNAIYFKDEWSTPFPSVGEGDFSLVDGNTVPVPMMFNQLSVPYLRGDNFSAAALPYANSDVSMLLILPDEAQWEAVEAALDLNALVFPAEPTALTLQMPKFSFKFNLSIKNTLIAMGLTDPFGPAADFSGMAEGGLSISDAFHQAFIAVDEYGTEAAAATAIVMTESAMMTEVEMTLNRPFIFALRDEITGSILFLGRVLDPRAE